MFFRSRQSARPNRQHGLTMVEMVVAIVTMSIIAIGLTGFITNTTESYAQTAARNQVSAAGRVVLDKLAMELRNALPESVRVTAVDGSGDQCLEFIPVLAATNYLDAAFRPAAARTEFDVVDFVPSQTGVGGRYAVVYPTAPSDLYRDSFSDTEAIVPATISDPVASDGKQRLTTASHRFKRRSATERIFVTGQPASYCVSGNKLYRYSDYGFHQAQLVPAAPDGSCASTCLPQATPNRVLLTDQIDNAALNSNAVGGDRAFDWAPASRQRNGMVRLQLNFNIDGQQLLLSHEVMQQVAP